MGANLRLGTKELAATAVMGALATIATMMFAFPIPATSGYFNFGDAIPSATMENGTANLKWISVDPKSKTKTITQQDEIVFVTDPTGRSTFTVKRAGATLLEVK